MIKKEFRKPVVTSLGLIEGRDAIFLEEIKLTETAIQISGEIGGGHCTNGEWGDDIPFWITFENIISLRMVELDFYEYLDYESSFDVVENSMEIQRLKEIEGGDQGKLTPGHKHYIFATYDSVFDVIAARYNFKTFKAIKRKIVSLK